MKINKNSDLRTTPRNGAFYPGSSALPGDLLAIKAPAATAEQCDFLAGELELAIGLKNLQSDADPATTYLYLCLLAHGHFLRDAGFYFPQDAHLVATPQGFSVAVPKAPCGSDVALELLKRVTRFCWATASSRTPVADWAPRLQADLGKVTQPIPAERHMARAAFELGMPQLEYYGPFLQIGYGAKSVVLDGAITEHTPSMGVHFAREKSKNNTLLARAGFPIAEGRLVRDLDHALKYADALGYPVVVKPADRDGGNSVSANIQTPDELTEAFARAREASAKVIVEKHIAGSDYRLLLAGERLLTALERTPGGVTGNGNDTIATLLDTLNADPRRGDGQDALLHKIHLDDEARLMLSRQNLTLASIPPDGQFVPLRRAANHALGGMVRVVDNIHPDNVDLARRAMKMLRLDIAGIDLLLPDVTRSWREAGGAICEVNAQPYIGEVISRDFYKKILQSIVPGDGRIPLVLIIGAPEQAGELPAMPGLAVVDERGARRDGYPISAPGLHWLSACQAALYDRETTAALFLLNPQGTLAPVSPADRFDAAFVLKAPPQGTEALLKRAGKIYAVEAAGPALQSADLRFETIQASDLVSGLEAILSG